MKRIRYISILALAATCWLMTGQASAQKAAKSASVPKSNSITVGTIRFTLPVNLTVKDGGIDDKIFLAFDQKNNYGIFLSVPGENIDHITTIADIYEKGLKLFYSETNNYRWKEPSMYFNVEFSKYEKEQFAITGYNGKNRSSLNGRLIKFKDKEFFIGYLLRDNSAKSKKSFEDDEIFESEQACSSTLKIIQSITGEKPVRSSQKCMAVLIETP